MDLAEELDLLIDAVYEDESNFNNADPTTGMRCREKDDIEKELYDILKERAGQMIHLQRGDTVLITKDEVQRLKEGKDGKVFIMGDEIYLKVIED